MHMVLMKKKKGYYDKMKSDKVQKRKSSIQYVR